MILYSTGKCTELRIYVNIGQIHIDHFIDNKELHSNTQRNQLNILAIMHRYVHFSSPQWNLGMKVAILLSISAFQMLVFEK